jgi:hypothetical protein
MRKGIVASLAAAVLLTACAGDGSTTGATDSTNAPTSATATGPTGDTGATTGATGTPSPPVEAELEDGRHFGFIESVDPASRTTVFDLAYFLMGEEANDAAAEHGDEVPVPNDYYIVNDNPKLRTIDIADDAELVLLDWNRCCDETFAGEVDAFARAFDEGSSIKAGGFVYQGPLSPYWLTVQDGVVVRIEEQYLP